MIKKSQLMYSADFKRDYVACFALGLFFLIVISEITLAVALPAYMRRDTAIALSVRRLQLIATFDAARFQVQSIKPKKETVSAELRLISWTLNQMADHLRENALKLDSDQIALLQQQLNEMSATLNQLQKNISFSREYKLDCNPYIQRTLRKSGVRNVR